MLLGCRTVTLNFIRSNLITYSLLLSSLVTTGGLVLPCLPLSTPEWVQLEEELFELLLKFSHLQRNEGTLMFMTGLYKSACMSLSHIMMPYKPARILAPTFVVCPCDTQITTNQPTDQSITVTQLMYVKARLYRINLSCSSLSTNTKLWCTISEMLLWQQHTYWPVCMLLLKVFFEKSS